MQVGRTNALARASLAPRAGTCRFAQRVACVANSVSLNEELDPALIIRRLKGEIKARTPPRLNAPLLRLAHPILL